MASGDTLFDGEHSELPLVVLAHGAGAPMDSGWMQQVACGLAARGLQVARFEFPYMRHRRASRSRRGPDRAAVLIETWREQVNRFGPASRLVIGGKSMGGRIASMIADEAGVAGLVCFGYPFHPPGKPDKLRTVHLIDLQTPTLVLQGTRDPFGKPEEVAGYGLSESIRVHWLEDGDHSLRPRIKSGRTPEQNLDEALDETASFVRALA